MIPDNLQTSIELFSADQLESEWISPDKGLLSILKKISSGSEISSANRDFIASLNEQERHVFFSILPKKRVKQYDDLWTQSIYDRWSAVIWNIVQSRPLEEKQSNEVLKAVRAEIRKQFHPDLWTSMGELIDNDKHCSVFSKEVNGWYIITRLQRYDGNKICLGWQLDVDNKPWPGGQGTRCIAYVPSSYYGLSKIFFDRIIVEDVALISHFLRELHNKIFDHIVGFLEK
jgi:hypothetical protein